MPPKPLNPPIKDFDEAISATHHHIDDAIRATHQHIDERFQNSNQHLDSQLQLMQTKFDIQYQIQASRHESLKTYLADFFKQINLTTQHQSISTTTLSSNS